MCAVCLGYPGKKKDSNDEEERETEIYTLLNVYYFTFRF